ncbi:MAG: hypothetical protein ACE5KH_03870 [Candidatus Geothermarchaeales archaeon]
MAKTKKISAEEFEKMGIKKPVSQTGQEALEILTSLKKGEAVMIEDASRGLQVALSRRVNKEFKDVEMRVNKIGDKRNIGLMKKG